MPQPDTAKTTQSYRRAGSVLPGALLRAERIRQNKGQKEVCFGICVPSYLSKIEHGSVCPDREILAALFGRLEIPYETDDRKLAQDEALLARYFYNLQYELDTHTVYQELQAHEQRLRYSEAAIDWLLVNAFEQTTADHLRLLEALEEHMNPKQHAYYRLLQAAIAADAGRKVLLCQEACEILHHSYAMVRLCYACFLAGNYAAIHAMEQRVVAAAVEEGNTFRLADYFFINGSAYACLNREEAMMVYYERSIRLLQNTGWQDRLSTLYYNIGATCISLHKYEQALAYLHQAEQTEGSSIDILHKKAIAWIRMGKPEEAAPFLDQLREALFNPKTSAGAPPCAFSTADRLKYEEAMMECHDGFLDDPLYLELLEQLIQEIRKTRHFGHLYFYKDMIIEACKRQRQYKKALEFEKEISGNIINQGL